jgi:transposase-like protein
MRVERSSKRVEGSVEEKAVEKQRDEVIEGLLKQYGSTQEAIFGQNGLMKDLMRRVVEKALAGELTHHLGYSHGEEKAEGVVNQRNGYSTKRLQGEGGEMEIAVPRDREGSFEPLLVPKGKKRLAGLDEKILGLYARGMTLQEIRGFIEDQYGMEVSRELISEVTDSVLEAVHEWQNRPLERVYPIVIFDALWVKIKEEGMVKNQAVYLALGTRLDGSKEILGIWVAQSEGAKFWMRIMNELKGRGVADVLIAVVDGLKGFPEAIQTVYPRTTVQTCIVHLMRESLAFCGWKERKAVARELKEVYRASNAEEALRRLELFAASALGKKYEMIVSKWKRNWEAVIPFFAFGPAIRKKIYTTNAIESVNMQVRKIIKNRGHFPSAEAAMKLIYLALQNATKRWKKTAENWSEVLRELSVMYGERLEGEREPV